jgi:flagellar motor switch protein FliM
MAGVMDVHVSIEAHISLEHKVLPAIHVLVVGDVLKDNKTQGLSKA